MKAIYSLPFLAFLLFSQLAYSQNHPAIAPTKIQLSEIEKITLPEQDNSALLAAENARRSPGVAPQFAKNIAVDLSPDNSGHWEIIDQQAIWRLRISSKGALSLNLGFSTYEMPEGGSLVIYSENQNELVGPFTAVDNEEHRQLWTPIIQTEEMIIEVVVPLEKRNELNLNLSYVNHDFMGFGQVLSGSCNLDVNCSEDDGWGIVDGYRDIIRSVAVIGTGGGTFCTGFLINNANSDGTPYFMTADHCGINAGSAASLVAYWKFEQSNCREPGSTASGGAGNGQLNIFNTGSIFRAGWGPSDFVIVELDDPVPAEAEGFMAGYSLEVTLSQDTSIGIHHPRTDEKRISFEFEDTYLGEWGSGATMVPDGDHVIVADWDIGTTEGGSSGSPLFDKNKRVIGQLHGGQASCLNDAYDSYGWFGASWEGGGTPSTRLRDWLDPDNTGVTTVDGLDLAISVSADPVASTFCYPTDAMINLTASENFVGPVTLVVEPALPMGVEAIFSQNPIMPGASTTLTFTFSENPGNSTLNYIVLATDNENNSSTNVSLNTLAGAPELVTLMNPANEIEGTSTKIRFEWEALSGAQFYDFQIAEDPGFTTIIQTINDITDTKVLGTALEPVTDYYWRIRANNICGIGAWSTIFKLTTGFIICNNDVYDGAPVVITTDPGVFTSTLEVQTIGFIDEVNIKDIVIEHTYVGDLKAVLISPEGTEIVLFDRIGVPSGGYGCPGNDLYLSFSDLASQSASDLEMICGNNPAVDGEFRPVDPLANLNGENPLGTWTLEITDSESVDGGQILDWALEICSAQPSNTALLTVDDPIICEGTTQEIDLSVGSAYTGAVTITTAGLPVGASMNFSQNPADPGSVVQITIDAGTAALGDYEITFSGNDGTNVGDGDMDISIIDGPGDFALLSPIDQSLDQPQEIDFNWEASAYVDYYEIIVYERGTTTVVEQTTTQTPSTTFNFPIGGKYDWTVTAFNDCGNKLNTQSWSFDVIGDLSFNLENNTINGCIGVSLNFTLTVGQGYFNPAVITYEIGNSPDVQVDFDTDINNVAPGSVITGSMTFNPGNYTGSYPTLFFINDGTHNSQTQLNINIQDVPLEFQLLQPANESEVITLTPTISWGTSLNATSYLVEIATDADFNNIVISQNTTSSLFAPSNNLNEASTYYWRITANSVCGSFTSGVFSFDTFTSGTLEIGETTLQINPNPFGNWIELNMDSNWTNDQWEWTLIAADGKVLKSGLITKNQSRISTSELAAGLYFLRINNQESSQTERLVKL